MTNEARPNKTMSEELADALTDALFEANRDEHAGEPMTGERLRQTGVMQAFIAYELRTFGRSQKSVRARASEWDCAP